MSSSFRNLLFRCAILTFAPSVGAFAQLQTVNLYDLARRADEYYPLLRQRQAEVSYSKAHERTAGLSMLPNLALQEQPDYGTVNSVGGAYFPLGLIPSVSGGNSESGKYVANAGNIAIANLNWELYDFGYLRAMSDAASAESAVSSSQYVADKYNLRQSVVLLYIDWLRKYRLLQIRRDDAGRDSIVLLLIRANVLSGLRPGADSSTALATYSGARIAYLRSLNDFNLIRDQIEGMTGAPMANTEPDTLVAGLDVLQRISATTQVDSVNTNYPPTAVFVAKYAAQAANAKADEKQWLPKLQMNAAYWMRNTGVSSTGQFSDGGLTMPYSAYNYLFGLTATVTLTDLAQRRAHIRENRSLLESREWALKGQQLDVATQYKQARTSLAATMAQLEELPVLEQAANMSFQQQLALYRAGLNTLTDVTNSEYTLLQAETNLVITQTDLVKLEYLLAALSGKQDMFISQFKH